VNPKPDARPDPIDRDDVDDVVGLAEQLRREDESKLSLDEMKAVGRELDIADEHIERAALELQEGRRTEARAAEQQAKERALLLKKARQGALVAAGVTALIFVVLWVGAVSARGELHRLRTDVDAKRAQLVNVTDRQARVEAEFRSRPPSPDRDAELLGAENRVRVERKRYDESAAQYNSATAGTFAGLAVRFYDLPSRVPLSNEL
jgi:hypothetical protein